MTDNNSPSSPGDICPHLGSVNDAELRHMFANPIHICLHSKPSGRVSFEHQGKFCITREHIECPLYEGPGSKPLPDFIRLSETSHTKKKRSKWISLAVILLILLIGSGIGLGFLSFRNSAEPGKLFTLNFAASSSPTPVEMVAEPTRTSTPYATHTAAALPTEALTPTSQPSDTPVPTGTEVAPPTPGPNLGTPFGNYVLYRVKAGESLAWIGNLYQIASERITAVNIIPEGRGVWAGDVLVIPIGSETDEGVRFQYIFIEKKTDLATLAETYAVAIDRLREYNLLGPLDWVPAGRWLIIPVVGE